MYVPRAMAPTIRRALKTFPAVVITGPRQSGKTTLLLEEFGKGRRYASLEDPDTRARSLADPRAFLEANAPPCILDEVQNAPHLLHYVKTAIDSNRKPGQWLLTGSRSFPLMEGVSQSLAGRAAILHLLGLAAPEIPAALRLATPSEILRGSFPEPRLSSEVDLRLWMGSYLQTYLERDVRQIVQVGDLVGFEQFTRLCAARTAQTLNLAGLARDAGVSGTTAKRWLSVLEASSQFFRLPSYARSATKRLVKAPKLYAADTGLAAFLTGHRDRDVLWDGPMKGPLFETLVLGEILKHYRNSGDQPAMYYWRSSDGIEVDIVIEIGGKLHGIETKANATPTPRHADQVTAWRRIVGRAVGRTVVACDCRQQQPLAPGVEAIPWREVGRICAGL